MYYFRNETFGTLTACLTITNKIITNHQRNIVILRKNIFFNTTFEIARKINKTELKNKNHKTIEFEPKTILGFTRLNIICKITEKYLDMNKICEYVFQKY